MKAILLASALAFGGTAFAQDTTTTTTQQPPAADMPAPTTPPAAPMAPEAPTAPTSQTAPAAPMAPAAPTAPDASTSDPAGGYAPAGPALQGTLAPGQRPVFQPSMTPAQAYPPPPPLQNYPICKKGQYDNCRQRGG